MLTADSQTGEKGKVGECSESANIDYWGGKCDYCGCSESVILIKSRKVLRMYFAEVKVSRHLTTVTGDLAVVRATP